MSFTKSFAKGIKPLPDYTVTQWADANRILTTKSSAEPGPWKTSRTPYLKEIMDLMSPKAKDKKGSPVNKVVFVKGSQLGGSEALINCLGYYIDICPCPILYMVSTVDLAKFTSTDRIDPLIELVPNIRKKIGEKRTHNAENAILKKGFAGGSLRFIGANSPVGMRSAAVRLLIMDEVSSYPESTEEGDSVELAIKRAQTFGESKKILAVSTPTTESECKITRMFLKTDQRYYNVPCPHCSFFQVLHFKNMKWDKGNSSSVYLECEGCKEKIFEELHKSTMLEKGKWIPKVPEAKEIGFHLSSMYAPDGWKKWSEIVEEYEEAQGKPSLEMVFCNTVLGEPYRLKGDSVKWEKVFDRREKYERNIIPKSAALLTCGVDVQADRLELEIVAWSREKQSYSIDFRCLFGDTAQDQVWKELNQVINEDFKIEGTNNYRKIQMTCVDSGYNSTTVYNFCRKYSPSHVMAVKGFHSLPMIFANPKNIDYSHKGKTIRNGVRLTNVGSSVLKQELYGFLKNDKNEDSTFPYGYCHFPWEYSQDYFQMLCAEEYVRRVNKKSKQEKFEWVKIRERNEALDCRNYARAAASLLGYDRMKESDFDKLEKQFSISEETRKSMVQQKKLNKAMREREIENYESR